MKKLSYLVAAAAVIATSTSFAHNAPMLKSGAYVGIEGSRTNLSLSSNVYDGEQQSSYKSTSNIGYGANLGYNVIGENGVLLGIEAYYTKLGAQVKSNEGNVIKVNNNYGADLHIGYSFGSFAPYLIAGYASTNYKLAELKGENEAAAVFGIGAVHKICDNVSLSLKYTEQKLNINKSIDDVESKVGARLQQLKLGVAYAF